MSNLQAQFKIQTKLKEIREKLLHLSQATQSINADISEKTLHDQLTLHLKELQAMAINLEWEIHQVECCG